MTELSDEERALLEAETAQPEPEPQAEAAPEPAAEEATPEPEEKPKRQPRKPRADSTDVEDSAPSEELALEHRVIPIQWDGDPWGDTPVQSRF